MNPYASPIREDEVIQNQFPPWLIRFAKTSLFVSLLVLGISFGVLLFADWKTVGVLGGERDVFEEIKLQIQKELE